MLPEGLESLGLGLDFGSSAGLNRGGDSINPFSSGEGRTGSSFQNFNNGAAPSALTVVIGLVAVAGAVWLLRKL